jgi:hypothetical protein
MSTTSRALAFAARWFDPATVHRVFEPLVADWQREWQDSTPARRAWVTVRWLTAFACALFVSAPVVIATPIPAAIVRRVAVRVSLFCVVATALMLIPAINSFGTSTEAMLLLPGILILAFPFAMVAAVDAIRCHEDVPPHIERAAAFRLALLGVIMMVTVGGVVIPVANQQFRVSQATRHGVQRVSPMPGLREMTTWELLTDPDRAAAPLRYTRAGEIRKELINRTVLCLLPAMMIWLRWAALNEPRRGRFWPLPASVMAPMVVVAYFGTFFYGFVLENQWDLKPGSGLWLPMLLFGSLSLWQQWRAKRARASA